MFNTYYAAFFVCCFCCLTAQPLQAQLLTATVNSAIPEGDSQYYDLHVLGLPNNIDAGYGLYEVCIDIDHESVFDLSTWLHAPDGTTRQLTASNSSDTGSNYSHTCFRLFASTFIGNGAPPFDGAYMPREYLNVFNNGQNPNGIWQLELRDNINNGIVGFLKTWQLRFAINPAALALQNSTSRLPIIKITTADSDVPDDPKTEGTIQVIDNSGTLPNAFGTAIYTFQSDIAIERQGYSSAYAPKPNYDFELYDALGNNLDTALLGMPRESDWILKGGYTDEYMMKDVVTFTAARDMEGEYVPRVRHCELVLNGTYQGVYILTEKVKRDKNRVNIAKLQSSDITGDELTGGYIFEINPNGDAATWYSDYEAINNGADIEFKLVYPHSSDIQPQQRNYLHAYVDSFEHVLHAPNFQHPTEGWRRYAAEKSFIDFLIVNEFSANYDSYGRSTYLYKEKITDGNKIHCGPSWDYDRGYAWGTETGWVHYITHPGWGFPFWWSQFSADSLFQKKLTCRYFSLRQDALSNANFHHIIDSTQAEINDAMWRNDNYWGYAQVNVGELKNWLDLRLAWIDSELADNDPQFPPLSLADTLFCTGTPIDIFAGYDYTYNFKPGPDTSLFVPTQAGSYVAQVESRYGCTTEQAFTVKLLPEPAIDGSVLACNAHSYVYSVAVPLIGTIYNWTISGNGSIIAGQSTSSILVQWGDSGTGTVSVTQTMP